MVSRNANLPTKQSKTVERHSLRTTIINKELRFSPHRQSVVPPHFFGRLRSQYTRTVRSLARYHHQRSDSADTVGTVVSASRTDTRSREKSEQLKLFPRGLSDPARILFRRTGCRPITGNGLYSLYTGTVVPRRPLPLPRLLITQWRGTVTDDWKRVGLR